MRLAPSLLAADLADLAGALALCEKGGADLVHFDVMDGHFVPNLSFGIPVLKAVRARTRLPIDVHLMVSNPDRLLDDYLAAGASRLIVHWEAAPHLDRLLERIRKGGAEAGVAVNPATPVELLTDALPRLDFVLVMSVNPGFGGQDFLDSQLPKIAAVRAMIDAAERPVALAVDGGITPETAPLVIAAGADTLIAGTAVFGAPDSGAAIAALRAAGAAA
jgi:ribulose-phosphate 3-epimerase